MVLEDRVTVLHGSHTALLLCCLYFFKHLISCVRSVVKEWNVMLNLIFLIHFSHTFCWDSVLTNHCVYNVHKVSAWYSCRLLVELWLRHSRSWKSCCDVVRLSAAIPSCSLHTVQPSDPRSCPPPLQDAGVWSCELCSYTCNSLHEVLLMDKSKNLKYNYINS